MRILAIDDEYHALQALKRAISEAVPEAETAYFDSVEPALAYAKKNGVDVAFIDIKLKESDGLTLAKRLKDIYGDTNIIFVTAYSSFAGDAFRMHASGYAMKPISAKRIANELENLRQPLADSDFGLRAQCFGSFEVFFNGKPLLFNRPKSKEVFAYLIDRKGTFVSKKELAVILWENQKEYSRSIQSHLNILTTDMVRVLKSVGVEDVILRKHGYLAVDTAKIRCDYFDFEKGVVSAVNSYHGEYMSNYSWAEFTVGLLNNYFAGSDLE